MSGGGGGGAPLFGAYAVVRNLLRGGRSPKEDAQRAALDAEELRDVEYESMGMHAPELASTTPASVGLIGRLHISRFLARFRRNG